jgi:hypothetical protein
MEFVIRVAKSTIRAEAKTSRLRPAGFRVAWIMAALVIPGGTLAAVPPAKSATPASPAAKGAAPRKGAPTAAAPSPSPVATAAALHWTGATPDEMVDRLFTRAQKGGDDALAALVVATSLDERASFGKVRDGLKAFAASTTSFADEARWLNLWLTPEPPASPWPGYRAVSYDAPPDPNGLVKTFAILGPFQDTSGGLMRREGPEAPGQSWSDMRARFAWGVYDVAWRRALPTSATSRGLPLDLYIHPRSESCSYVAARVTVPKSPRPMLIHVAASGAVRLIWDGADVVASEEIHPHLLLDRITARVEPSPGDHLVAVKVCSAAMNDEGRVRLRFTDERRAPLPLATSSDLTGLKITSPPASARSPEASRPAPPSASPRAPAGKPPGAEAVVVKPGPSKPPAAPGRAGLPPSMAAQGPANALELPGKKGPSGKLSAPSPSALSRAPLIVPPAGVTVIPTALAKALAHVGDVGAAPAIERSLAASILRTLGGADDARSPRAPGLLDRVTGTAGASADTLAIAGWISPFGANRSGWLNLARSRATAERDPATAAFAQRRLAAAHISSHYVDWAFSMLREEPLLSANDTEARLIKAMAKRKLNSTGLGRAALEDLLTIEAELKDKTPLGVLTEIFDAAKGQPEIQLRIARRLAEIRADARDDSYVHAFRSQGAAALEIAAAQSLSQQVTADDLTGIAKELLEAGRYAWAREAYYVATQLAPNRSPAFKGLAVARQAMTAVSARDGKPASEDPALALMNLVRARDLEPGDATLKAELAFRTDEGTDGGPPRQAMRDEQYLIAPETFLQRARQNPFKKGTVVDREPHWVRVVTYHPDKRVSQLMHYSREIVIEPRTENDLFENVPAEGDDTELLFARVHRKDGTVSLPEEQSSGGRQPLIRWPDLKTGDVIEVAVRSWTAGPVGRRGDAPFTFIDYVGSTDTHPVLYNEVVVDSPQGSPLAIDVLNGKPERIVPTQKDGRTVTRYIWDAPPVVPDEPLAPKLTETLPVVVGSTFASWGDFREWYRSAVSGFTEPDDQVRRLAEDLTRGKKTREDKLQAIFEFVADDIRYVNFVSGEWWLPNRPQELLARRQGDCDDKAMLLITLLRAIGIEATEVLVQTRYTGQPSLLRSEKAAIPIFDHGIAYLPGKNGAPGTWLDATSPESRLGPLPSMDARTLALFVNEGPPKIIETPASSPDDHGVDADWTITLSPSGAGELTASERHTGDAAFELRMNLKQADARSQWVEQRLASGWFPTVQVKGQVDFKPDLPKGVARLRYGAQSDGFARREGEELAVPTAEASTLTSQLAPLVKRTLPVVLPPNLAPGHETHTITVVAPPRYTFGDLPPGGDEPGGEFGKAHLEFARVTGKNAVIVKRSVVFDLSSIPVEKYEKWRSWLQRVDGLMHRMVRLVPDGSEKLDKGVKKELPKVASPSKAGAASKTLNLVEDR